MPQTSAPFAKGFTNAGGGVPAFTGLGPSKTNPSRSTLPAAVGPMVEIGSSGLAQYGGFVRDEFLPQLQGDRGLRVYREMYDNDPIVGALVFAIQMLMRKVEWRVEPPEAATVDGIVAARQKKLREMLLARAQERQAQQMMAGAGQGVDLAPNPSGGSGPGQGLGIPGVLGAPATAPTPSFAAPATPPTPAPAFHEPIKKSAAETVFDDWWATVTKAGSGTMAGGIGAADVGTVPLDPETGEPMEFPIGAGILDPPSPEEIKAMTLAVMVETCLHDMDDSWADTISQIITMIVYGFSFHELVYKVRKGYNDDDPQMSSRYNDGMIGWAKFAGRAQETRHRWEFGDHGEVLGMWQLAPPTYQIRYIPMQKALLFRTTGYKSNPEGRSVLRSAFRHWSMKRRIEEYEAIGIERDLAGLPVITVPHQWMSPWASPDEKAALAVAKEIVRNVRNDEQGGLVIPAILDPETHQPLFKFELVGSSSKRAFDTDKVITRYDQRIAMVALVDFILLGHEGVGAKALAEVKANLFTSAIEAWIAAIADVINKDAIPRLMKMNGEDPAMSPRIAFGKMASVSLTEMAGLLTALAGAGADLFPDTQLEDAVRGLAGLPAKAASDSL